ncbi:hypothetical protein [Eubacterium sp.]|uniref:hypothetical protein n=1 Tax=Eubacterium sp. TaxID=142586 RepID=UPI0026DF17C0|nr:hypothetical protein [Eubacterium sp.]MDO5433604.1 hypothetical protein [Eubacterium sp.]
MAITATSSRRKQAGIRSLGSDRTFKGCLIEIKRTEKSDLYGRKRACHLFTIRSAFTEKTFEHVGDHELNLLSYYDIGEKVIHHAGYSIPTKVRKDPDVLRICIECGEMIPHGRYTCPYCGSGVR